MNGRDVRCLQLVLVVPLCCGCSFLDTTLGTFDAGLDGWSFIPYANEARLAGTDEVDGNTFAVIPGGTSLTSKAFQIQADDRVKITIRARAVDGAGTLNAQIVAGPGDPLWPEYIEFFEGK